MSCFCSFRLPYRFVCWVFTVLLSSVFSFLDGVLRSRSLLSGDSELLRLGISLPHVSLPHQESSLVSLRPTPVSSTTLVSLWHPLLPRPVHGPPPSTRGPLSLSLLWTRDPVFPPRPLVSVRLRPSETTLRHLLSGSGSASGRSRPHVTLYPSRPRVAPPPPFRPLHCLHDRLVDRTGVPRGSHRLRFYEVPGKNCLCKYFCVFWVLRLFGIFVLLYVCVKIHAVLWTRPGHETPLRPRYRGELRVAPGGVSRSRRPVCLAR